ncbi:unnamed protein product, partial [Ectocarpus sp. 12 AP-2014]
EGACVTDLVASTAFGGTDPMVETVGPLKLSERVDIGLSSLALRAGVARPSPFGLALPGPGEAAAGQSVRCFWAAPGQWMIEGQGRADEDFAAAVAAEAPGCSVTEQTDGWVIIDIEGPAKALETLRERLINLPASALAPGKATRTLMHHMSVFVIRRSDDRLTVMGMRMLAGSLWHTLTETAGRLR